MKDDFDEGTLVYKYYNDLMVIPSHPHHNN